MSRTSASKKPHPNTPPTRRIHPRRESRPLINKDLQHALVEECTDAQRLFFFFFFFQTVRVRGIREERVRCCFRVVVDRAVNRSGIRACDLEGLCGRGPG